MLVLYYLRLFVYFPVWANCFACISKDMIFLQVGEKMQTTTALALEDFMIDPLVVLYIVNCTVC